MDGGPPGIEARVAELERVTRALEDRIAALEPVSYASLVAQTVRPAVDASPTSGFNPVALLSLIGRTFVVLGGAYLLRALTESAALPARAGVTLGFAYATAWLVAADRAAARGRVPSAAFHGATASLIAFPLLWEAATRFQIVEAGAAGVLLTTIAVVVLGVAIHTGVQLLAWLAVIGAIVSSLALTAATGFVLPFAVADIALGIVTLWIGYAFDWVWLRWPVALTADLACLALAAGVSARTSATTPSRIVAVQLFLLIGYLTSVAVRTLVRGRDVNLFEVLQSTAALAVGFGGAVYVARATGVGAVLLVPIGLASGAACYAVAFAFVARRQGLGRNFYFYTSMALILVLACSALWLDQVALLWAALAVLASWAAQRADRLTLTVHGAVYVVGAAIASGLLASATTALVGAPASQSPFTLGGPIVFAAGCGCWLMPVPSDVDASARFERLPRLAIAIVLAWAAAAWMVAVVVSSATDPGVVATIRTGALTVVVLALAWLGRNRRFQEAAWLVYPLLAVGAVKLLLEDLPRSRAATLFVALALYGGALIAAPRIGQRPRSDARP